MENLKIVSRYQSFVYESRHLFYRPDYQKFLMCPLIKRLERAFVSKHGVDPLKCSAELLKHSAERLKYSAEVLSV